MSMPVTTDSLRAGAETDVTLSYEPKPLTIDDPPTTCRLHIYRPTTGLIAVVFTELADNQGMTITNAAERLASLALNKYVFASDWPHAMFFQHYPPEWFERYPLRPRAGAEHWTEEMMHFRPALHYNSIGQCWLPNHAGDTTWNALAKLYGCRLEINDKLFLGQYNHAMYAIVTWLAGREVDLLSPNIPALVARHGINGEIPREVIS